MPTLNITTNVPGDRVALSDALKTFSAAVASSVGKPERYVMVSITTDKPMIFAGTEAPTAYAELLSIGAIGGAKNMEISRAVSEVLQSQLGVPPDRFYLKFCDVGRSDFGYNGSTF